MFFFRWQNKGTVCQEGVRTCSINATCEVFTFKTGTTLSETVMPADGGHVQYTTMSCGPVCDQGPGATDVDYKLDPNCHARWVKNQSCLLNEYPFGCPKVLGDRVEHGRWLQDVPLRGEAVQWRRQDATDSCSRPVTSSSGAGQTERRGDITMNPAGKKRIRN